MIRLGLTLATLLLASCESTDPYRRVHTWQPTGSTAGNIAAMVAHPGDLIQGRGSVRTDAHQSAVAVEQLWLDQQQDLPGVSTRSAAASASRGPR